MNEKTLTMYMVPESWSYLNNHINIASLKTDWTQLCLSPIGYSLFKKVKVCRGWGWGWGRYIMFLNHFIQLSVGWIAPFHWRSKLLSSSGSPALPSQMSLWCGASVMPTTTVSVASSWRRACLDCQHPRSRASFPCEPASPARSSWRMWRSLKKTYCPMLQDLG